MKELEAMGWQPQMGYAYDRRMNVPDLLRGLFREAAYRPEFEAYRKTLLDCALRDDTYALRIAGRWPHRPHTGGMWFENVTVARNVREVSEAGVVRSYQVAVHRRPFRVVRNLPTLEAAISYRDRVIEAIEQGSDPSTVPLFITADTDH